MNFIDSFAESLAGPGGGELSSEIRALIDEENARSGVGPAGSGSAEDSSVSNHRLAQYVHAIRWARARPWVIPTAVASVLLVAGYLGFTIGRKRLR